MAIDIPTDRVPRGDVVAKLNFYVAPADGSQPFNYVHAAPEGEPQRNFSEEAKDVLVQDIRGREAEFARSPDSLDRHAFLVVQNQPPSAETDFVDDASIRANYYPEVEALLLKHVPGARRVVFFDHTVRRAKAGATPPTDRESRGPVTRAHIDQSAAAAPLRVRKHLPPDEADKILGEGQRFRIINVWRPLNKGPVEAFPLAFASSASVRDEDVVPVEHRYPDYRGQTAGIKYHPDQQWYYLSGMRGDERLLLECFDSEALSPTNTTVRGGRLAHSAFEHPRSLPDAEDRQSIEVRTLVFGP